MRNQHYGAVSKTIENGRQIESACELVDERKSTVCGTGKPTSVSNRNHRPAETTNKKYGEISDKKDMTKRRTATVEDLPSELSDDEWGEVQRYGQILH